jgi:hypothetical protein
VGTQPDLFNTDPIPYINNTLTDLCADKDNRIILHYWKEHLDRQRLLIFAQDAVYGTRARRGTLVNMLRCNGVSSDAHAYRLAEIFFAEWIDRRLTWL